MSPEQKISTDEKDANQFTIDELARRSGMTVRNIRAHQSRGLVPAPVVIGRTGFYGREHLDRLEAVKDLQANGFNLTAIQRLIEQADASGQNIGDIRNAVLTPFDDEEPEIVDFLELAREVGIEDADEQLIKKAEALGFIFPVGDGKHEVLSPTILRAGLETVRVGVPVDVAFGQLTTIRKHCRAIADGFSLMVDEHVVRPYEENGLQQEGWPHVREAIQRLRPVAAEVVLAAFKIQMTESAEEQYGRALTRAARQAGGGGRVKGSAKAAGKVAGMAASKATPRRRSGTKSRSPSDKGLSSKSSGKASGKTSSKPSGKSSGKK